ncbi:LuxR C-terminal-related transcriptional regulator [Streptomyces antibioticus]|uniref:LuxR C-terminal-related transcriptional regulator n=1 Tax=Streptomyces antibioticus TaxID=1890 RepID=UPI0036AD90B4
MAGRRYAFPWARTLPAEQLGEFLEELWAAASGETGMATLDAVEKVIAAHRPRRPPSPLTEREAEVLTLLAQGLTYRQTAHTLTLSLNTVRILCGRAFSKVGARGAAQAVAVAVHYGWITAAGLPGEPRPAPAKGTPNWQKLYAQVAEQLRRDPDGFIDIGPYAQRNSTQKASRRINKGLLAPFAPAGAFHARSVRDADRRWVLRVHYVGDPAPTEAPR